jgi:23S rRNA (cytosine1962-C5)-methyltransferase
MPSVRLNPKASQIAHKGRPWFFHDDLDVVDAGESSLVTVRDHEDRSLGLGFYSQVSKIPLRLCGGWGLKEVPPAETFFRERLEAAVQRRAQVRGAQRGVRLVHGEGDLLPGLVVDQFADCLVLQSTSTVIEQNLSHIVPPLVSWTGAASVLARNDVAARKLEGLPQEVRLLHGNRVTETEIEEHGIRHPVHLWTGQKTGFYLDQRPARKRVMELAAERRVLDLCSYQGAFALAALGGGARSALAVDQAVEALELASSAAERNGLAPLKTLCANVFDILRELRNENSYYDLVVLDPPAFAKSRKEREGALRGYRDLNRLAMRILAPGGYLLTCSCSHHVDMPTFERVLRQAAAELPFPILLRERLGAGADHPVWINLPESEYLKVYLLERA